MTQARLTAKVYPHRYGLGMGNIIWAERDRGDAYGLESKYAMRGGRFPADHPVAPGDAHSNDRSEMGKGVSIEAFRERGYWASCFPEGDGITWKPERGQDEAQCLTDIRECFPSLDIESVIG